MRSLQLLLVGSDLQHPIQCLTNLAGLRRLRLSASLCIHGAAGGRPRSDVQTPAACA